MLGFTIRFAQRAFSQLCGSAARRRGVALRLHAQALLAGVVLGTLVHALAAAAQGGGEPRFRLAMALVMVAAGGLAFVLYAQHAQPARRPAQQRLADARVCASLLGCGLVAALHVLPRLTG